MANITITSVPDEVKRGLQIACLQEGTDMSSELRARLPDITAEIEDSEEYRTKEELKRLLSESLSKTFDLLERLQELEKLNKIQSLALSKLPGHMTRAALETAREQVEATAREKAGEKAGAET